MAAENKAFNWVSIIIVALCLFTMKAANSSPTGSGIGGDTCTTLSTPPQDTQGGKGCPVPEGSVVTYARRVPSDPNPYQHHGNQP